MGYMGFGMKKDVYTWRPKKIFSRLKKHYKIEYKKGLYIKSTSISKKQREKIKQNIRSEIRSQNIKIAFFTFFIFIGLVALIILLVMHYSN